MNPTLSLGPWDAPSLEIEHGDLYPILAALIEKSRPVEPAHWGSIVSLLQVDGLYLREDTENFFLMFAEVCHRITAGEIKSYDPSWIDDSDIRFFVRTFPNDGIVTSGAKAAASRFMRFLAGHPDYWPLRQ